jgi:hypothetical protein
LSCYKPKGIAIEPKRGSGVGFFSKTGKLISVIFDEVREDRDHQTLEFNSDWIEVTVRNGRVIYYKVSNKSAKHG